MKSRVQRGRRRLRELLDECCAIALDVRWKILTAEPREDVDCCREVRKACAGEVRRSRAEPGGTDPGDGPA